MVGAKLQDHACHVGIDHRSIRMMTYPYMIHYIVVDLVGRINTCSCICIASVHLLLIIVRGGRPQPHGQYNRANHVRLDAWLHSNSTPTRMNV